MSRNALLAIREGGVPLPKDVAEQRSELMLQAKRRRDRAMEREAEASSRGT